MNLERLLRTRAAVAAAVLALSAAVVLLAGALVMRASEPRAIVVVPGAPKPEVLEPRHVPDEAARAFAMLYVARLDNYTPSTVETLSERLRALVAPGYWSQAADALVRRSEISREARMASQVILPPAEEVTMERGTGLVVTIPAFRRTFIADKPAEERRIVYRISLETSLPGPANPHGLVVRGQEVRDE